MPRNDSSNSRRRRRIVRTIPRKGGRADPGRDALCRGFASLEKQLHAELAADGGR